MLGYFAAVNRIVFCSVLMSTLAASASPKKEVWIYTSIYKEFIAEIEAGFEKKYPDIDVKVFQSGSEKIQAKVEAEILSKKIQADLLVTSGPFWSYGLEKRGLVSPRKKGPSVDTNYNSLMVIIYNNTTPEAERPKAFTDLIKPDYKRFVQFSSPLESGTAFATVAYLSDRYGWEFFEKLGENHLASSGGNSAVIQKVESGEKKYGIVLLENALAAIKKGSPIGVIYPTDGSIPIPSMQVILKDSPNKEQAELLAQFILSKDGQMILRKGYMYSVRTDVPAPEGAEPFKQVTAKATPWTPERFIKFEASSKDIKKKYSEHVLE